MMMNDPWFDLLNQSGGGSIDMSRGFSSLGNLPPLDWMPNPGAEHGVDVRGQFPWNAADTRTYFQWYETVLFERAREEDRRLRLGMPKKPRILLAGNGEIQLDTSVSRPRPRKVVNGVVYEFSDVGGFVCWHEVNPFAGGSQDRQRIGPPRSPQPPGSQESPGSPPSTPYRLDDLTPTTTSSKQPSVWDFVDAAFGPPPSVPPASAISQPLAPQAIGLSPPTGPSQASPATVPDYGSKGGYSIASPPPILGATSDALYVNPFWRPLHQAGWQEALKANPDWAKVALGLVASPLGYLEEGLIRPILNVPHTALHNVIMAGQHTDRSSAWLQQDEWGEAVAEGFEAVINLSLAFLDVASLLEGVVVRQPVPRASLAGEMPASVPREYAGAVSEAAGDRTSMLKPQLASALPNTSAANLQHVLRGGAGDRGIGVLHIDVSKLNPSEIDSTVAAVRDMDFQAGIASGLVRTSVPSRSIANSVASLGNKALSLSPTEQAGHLPDVAGGGSALGAIMGMPTSVNKSIGGQWRRYAPGFTFDGYSIVDRATGEFLYISHALENQAAPILNFRR